MNNISDLMNNYLKTLRSVLNQEAAESIADLSDRLLEAWCNGRVVYLCGNGGSAANAIHLANDLIYGVGVNFGRGIRAEALSANPAVLTCLANDIGYDQIYAEQLRVKANKDDVLIALSGSGNSENIVQALEAANQIGMQTFAVLGYSGGRCKKIAKKPIHFAVDDMQIAEDLQMMVGHMCMKWLQQQPTILRRVANERFVWN